MSKFVPCLCYALGLILAFCANTNLPAQPANNIENTETGTSEWVVVLDDPRPARLRGWQRPGYTGNTHYSNALELTRFAKRVAKEHQLQIKADWFIDSLGVYCLIVRFDEQESLTLKRLSNDKHVKWVQPSNQFDLLNAEISSLEDFELSRPAELDLPEGINGAGSIIGLIDSAVDDTHPSIAGKVIQNLDLVSPSPNTTVAEQHGTGIASVIIANRESTMGVTGLASNARLRAFRGCWENRASGPNCNTLTLARALDAAANTNLDVLNLSLTGPKDLLLDQIVARILSRGTKVVTAFDPNRKTDERFPSSAPGVITVMAASSNATNLDGVVTAPGSRLVAAPDNRAGFMSGHSVAAAYASGVLALCVQVEKQTGTLICNNEINNRLRPDDQTPSSMSDLLTQLAAHKTRSQ